MEKLKPCPFCGGIAKIMILDDNLYEVLCTNCDCQTPFYDKKIKAKKAWNRRTKQ